jgi:O-antigen/teichoic acid export membrane protein
VIAPATYADAALPCAILAFAFYFSALHQVTALGIAFGEKSRLVAIGWSGAALATFALAPALVPSFGAAGASWCVVLMYGGLNLYYVRESQRLHPLPFRARPIAVHVAVGLAAVGGAAAMDTREVSPGNIGLKLAVLAILVGVVLGAGGLNVPRVRTAITNLIALRRTRP